MWPHVVWLICTDVSEWPAPPQSTLIAADSFKTAVDNMALSTEETVFLKRYVINFKHEVSQKFPKFTQNSLPLFTYFCQLRLTVKLYLPPTSNNKPSLQYV